MKKGAKVGLILFVLVFLVVIAALAVAGLFWLGRESVPDRTIVEMDFQQPITEYVPTNDPIAQLLNEKTPTTLRVVEALREAAQDDRVVGLLARVGNPQLGLAQIEEIRDAVIAFRETGKPAIAWADGFGEFGPGNGGYYLATAFDEIYIQPSGDVGLTGLLLESPFVRGTFDKLDMTPRMDHRYEYKNAMNMFTETHFTEAHEEALRTVMDSIFDQIVAAIAEARGLTEVEVRSIIDRGPLYGVEAQEAKLVDGLLYRDQVYEMMRDKVGDEDADYLYLMKYRSRAGGPWSEGETVALIHGVGAVTRGSSGLDPLFGQHMGSDTVTQAFRDAIADDDVKAILFRVDSPGGSYVASDSIWREVVRAREAGKPVIVSMGNVAGSGGYFVSMAADKIVAHPSTITASIGVLGGKVLDRGLWNKLGITFDEVHTSESSTQFSSLHDYTEPQWDRFEAWLDRVYDDFTSKVAEGRDLPKDKVLEIAKGRIWTGADALELGLVDELGGYDVALRLVREAANLEPDAEIRLKAFPRPVSPFEALTGKGRDSSEPAQAMVAMVMRVTRPAAELARRLGLVEEPPATLTVPELELQY
jgi:protease-4